MPFWLILFLIFFLILSLTRLDRAVLLLIAALPAYLVRFSVFGLPLTLLEAMILICFAVWFFKNFLPELKDLLRKRRNRNSMTGRGSWSPYPFAWEIILVLIVSFAAAGISGFSAGALGIWKAYFFEPILLFILLLNVFKDKKDWSKILGALLISAAAVSIFAIYQKITGQFLPAVWAESNPLRVTSFFSYPNAMGLYLAPLVMVFVGWLFYKIKEKSVRNLWPIILTLGVIILSIPAVWFARSEGALAALAAGLIVFGLMATRRLRIITLIVLALAIVSIFTYAPLKSRILEKVTLSDLSGEIRQQQWRETMEMLNENGMRFLIGAGLNSYQAAVAPYHQEGIFFNRDHIADFDSKAYGNAELRAKYWQPVEIYLYPHNIFLNFWSELGLGGALLFAWIILKYLYTALISSVSYGRERRAEKYLALGLMMAMITIIVHGVVDVPYFKNDLAAMFWVLIALLGALNLHYQRRQELKN